MKNLFEVKVSAPIYSENKSFVAATLIIEGNEKTDMQKALSRLKNIPNVSKTIEQHSLEIKNKIYTIFATEIFI